MSIPDGKDAEQVHQEDSELELAEQQTSSNSFNEDAVGCSAKVGVVEDDDFVVIDKDMAVERGTPDFWQTLAGVVGNVLEWYDFAVFGFLSDVIGDVFFPAHQKGHLAITESFAVFGGAFLMRPIGGMAMGYIGDKYGRKKALVISILLMAFPTFTMGCLPSYDKVGSLAIVLLVIVRLLQGFSVGGQLMSSAVYTLESHKKEQWGYYGSLVLAAANFGTLLGSFAGWGLRSCLTDQQLHDFGWRIPFLSGIVVSFSGFYLRGHGDEGPKNATNCNGTAPDNPIKLAFAKHNRRSLIASSMVPMLWSSGFYLGFVWMAIFMQDLIENPVPGSFGVNAIALLLSVCVFFPYAGRLSDQYGRPKVMSIGGILMGVVSPVMIILIGKGNTALAFGAQMLIGVSLSLWGAPMIAWLVESFEPEARLTSVAIGYNLAQALVGGLTPALATAMVDGLGPSSPGILLTCVAFIGLVGLWCVAPPSPLHEFDIVCSHSSASQTQIPTKGLAAIRRRHKKDIPFSNVATDDLNHMDHGEEEETKENQIV